VDMLVGGPLDASERKRVAGGKGGSLLGIQKARYSGAEIRDGFKRDHDFKGRK